MARYRLSLRAREGLNRIVRSIESEFGAETAILVAARIVRAFELLAERPFVGHRRPDLILDPDIRFWSVRQTLIAYGPLLPDGIEILLVERAERDWDELLDSE